MECELNMVEKFIGIGGTDGQVARPFRTDEKGNQGVHLATRNELATFAVGNVTSKGVNTLINKYNDLGDYSAITVSVSLPVAKKVKLIVTWAIREGDEFAGKTVSKLTVLETTTLKEFSTGYLEIQGNQVTVSVANGDDVDYEASVFIMGIR